MIVSKAFLFLDIKFPLLRFLNLSFHWVYLDAPLLLMSSLFRMASAIHSPDPYPFCLINCSFAIRSLRCQLCLDLHLSHLVIQGPVLGYVI